VQKNHRLINDNIYRHIEYTKLEDYFLQTKIVNRLLFVTQNALAYFAFPSINTKRYIHSIGTMHLSAHMLKNSLLNSDEKVSDLFIKNLTKSMSSIIKKRKLNISLDNINFLDDKSLYEFTIPTKSKLDHNIYLIVLQSLRLVGLLHDLGHFPFSHQIEYALGKVYTKLQKKLKHTKKELEFIKFYKDMTNDGELVLHEAIGKKLVNLLFEYELKDIFENKYKNDYLILIHTICNNILNDNEDNHFSYKVLHQYIDGTVDADRLDYINRDLLASGYIGGAVDFLRITKQSVLIQENAPTEATLGCKFSLSFYDEGLLDIENMLEMRFNFNKKIIYSHKIARSDTLLENVVSFLSSEYFKKDENNEENIQLLDSISMLWKFLSVKDNEKKLDIISQLDENWLITLFKKEYFKIKYKDNKTLQDKKYLVSFEEVLFGKRFFQSIWKNLNDFYNVLEFSDIDRYKFRESFGNVHKNKINILKDEITELIKRWQSEDDELFLTFHMVSLSIGISKKFSLYDGESLISIDQVSTLRKRLKKSMLNSVPFFLYSNKSTITNSMKQEIKKVLFKYL